MLSASSRLLVFDESKTRAIFEGNPQLVEYFVGDVDIDFKNDRPFAVIYVKLQLLRRSGFIIMNVYIPSLLLLVISYLTLYFTPTNFQVRVLASLTSLLVMATLYTQASSSLPKTSYFKMMDVWLLSSIFFIFIIIVLHTIIDRVREWEPTKPSAALVGQATLPTDLSSGTKSSPSNTVHPSEGATEGDTPTGPAEVEEPQQKWWEAVDLCMKEAVAKIPTLGHRPRKTFEKMILGARIFVLALLIIFNITYWSVILH
ncbi:hypothetical protein Pmani_026748 [Petrolisthes manimaculis]|uniref:Neurotransmitter-gated ion-channel transmembrane domain-containing protein n=1 Tax=Petrolisthes manimaculis TaxID=1843537 RepID=A0AAE1P3I3_9EUCA|nr:hypothetical protein Pmani_026748 [Petrolisthes manimaculis]